MTQARNRPLGKILTRVWNRVIRKNRNWCAAVVGSTGSGKSYLALRLAELLDENFDVSRQCVFTARDFIEIIKSKDMKKGKCLIFDEAGCGDAISNRAWFTQQNQIVMNVIQTFRRKNLFTIFTVPSIKFIDIACRRLLHAIIKPRWIDYEKGECHSQYLRLQHNPAIGKTYTKYNWARKRNMEKYQIWDFIVRLPRKDIIDTYEKMARVYKESIIAKGVSQLCQIEKKEKSLVFDINKTFDIIKQAHTKEDKLTITKVINFLNTQGIVIGDPRARRLNTMWKEYIKER